MSLQQQQSKHMHAGYAKKSAPTHAGTPTCTAVELVLDRMLDLVFHFPRHIVRMSDIPGWKDRQQLVSFKMWPGTPWQNSVFWMGENKI